MNWVISASCCLALSACTWLAPESESKSKVEKETKEQPASIPTVDLNTASLRQLMALPGVGHTYAKHIVEGRPYKEPREILERKIVPPHVFEKCREHIIVVP